MRYISTLFILCLALSFPAFSQIDFRFDSVLYKTMYPKDLCKFLKENPTTRLFDVRSPGEYSDTSRFYNLNIGHLKNAVNIEIDTFKTYIPELRKDMKSPIILYCSHSQRSRRVSRMLSDSGFTKVWNLNGGMTWMNQASEADFPCKKEMVVHALPYKSIPALESIKLIKENKELLIVDLRPESSFNANDTIENNNFGRIKGAINIPGDNLKENMAVLLPHKNKAILLYDMGANESNKTALYLSEQGFTKVYTILGGLGAIIGKDYPSLALRTKILEKMPPYTVLNIKESVDLIKNNKNLVILDVRSKAEQENKSEMIWRNLGYIKDAQLIEDTQFTNTLPELEKYKNSKILLYGSVNAAKYAKILKDNGYADVNFMYGNLWEFVSAGFNVKSLKGARALLVNHEGLY